MFAGPYECLGHLAIDMAFQPCNLTALPRDAARLLWWGLEAKTRIYSSAVKSYSSHCAVEGSITAFPAAVSSLASWITSLSCQRFEVKTVDAYLTVVRSAHVDMAYEDLTVFDNPQLQITIAGMRHLQGESNTYNER